MSQSSLWDVTKASEAKMSAIRKLVQSDTFQLMVSLAREAGLPKGEIIPADPNLALVTHALKSCDKIGWNNCITFMTNMVDMMEEDRQHESAETEENLFGAIERQIQAAPPSMREGLRKRISDKLTGSK